MGEQRGFIERIAVLAGRTTYREPVGGRSTGPRLTDQDVAAAVAMGRLRGPDGEPDQTDIGPEVLYGYVLKIRHRKPDVCMAVEAALLSALNAETDRKYRVRKAVNAAYEFVVMDLELDRPEDFPQKAWDYLFSAGVAAMVNQMSGAMLRAERAFYAQRGRLCQVG